MLNQQVRCSRDTPLVVRLDDYRWQLNTDSSVEFMNITFSFYVYSKYCLCNNDFCTGLTHALQ